MQRVYLISGYRGSGKDTVGSFLSDYYDFRRVSFAGALKDLVAEKYGIPRWYLDDRVKKEAPLYQFPIYARGIDSFSRGIHQMLEAELPLVRLQEGHTAVHIRYWTPRALCILEGSIARAVDPQFWTKAVLSEIARNPDRDYVVTDLRYRSEAEAAKVLLPHCRIVRVSGRVTDPGTGDASERDLEGYPHDHEIDNRGTKDELYEQIRTILAGS